MYVPGDSNGTRMICQARDDVELPSFSNGLANGTANSIHSKSIRRRKCEQKTRCKIIFTPDVAHHLRYFALFSAFLSPSSLSSMRPEFRHSLQKPFLRTHQLSPSASSTPGKDILSFLSISYYCYHYHYFPTHFSHNGIGCREICPVIVAL